MILCILNQNISILSYTPTRKISLLSFLSVFLKNNCSLIKICYTPNEMFQHYHYYYYYYCHYYHCFSLPIYDWHRLFPPIVLLYYIPTNAIISVVGETTYILYYIMLLCPLYGRWLNVIIIIFTKAQLLETIRGRINTFHVIVVEYIII